MRDDCTNGAVTRPYGCSEITRVEGALLLDILSFLFELFIRLVRKSC